jgi:large subunit ribosomal protein L9
MQVILLKPQDGLGHTGDAVNVADGYARNFLLPRKVAVIATPSSLERSAKLKREHEAEEKKQEDEARALAKRLEALEWIVKAKVGEEDKLFGSVTTADVEALLKIQGFEIDKKKITVQEHIKTLGEYPVMIKVHPGVHANLKLQVVKE